MKKILVFVLLVSFISAAGLVFSGCSKDNKNKSEITDGGTPVYSFEGTWEGDGGAAAFKFTGSDIIYVGYGGGAQSLKGTFEYDGTYLTFNWTQIAMTGDAINGSVTWSDTTVTWPPAACSFTDANHFVISGLAYTKID